MNPTQADISGMVVHPVSGYQAVVDALRREIWLGRILPGQRLPPERKLAAELGISRDTVRQALRILEGSGQLTTQRGASGGAFIKELSGNTHAALLELRAREGEIAELIEFRTVIESGAAALAARRRIPEQLHTMEETQRQLRQATTVAQARASDTAFHLAVAAATGNTVLENTVQDARARMFALADTLRFDFLVESSSQGHDRVLRAITAGDSKQAALAMREHIQHTGEELHLLLAHADNPSR